MTNEYEAINQRIRAVLCDVIEELGTDVDEDEFLRVARPRLMEEVGEHDLAAAALYSLILDVLAVKAEHEG